MKRDAQRIPSQPRSFVDLSRFKDSCIGQKCFVCGAGPSIGFIDITPIHKHVVIAVNSSALLMPWHVGETDRRFWISNDVLCTQWDYFWSHVVRARCHKLVRTSWKQHDATVVRKYGFDYFEPRPSETNLQLSNTELCFVSSVPTAIDLSLLLGCSQIYLLGVDHRMVHGNSHFWQFWPKKKWPRRSGKPAHFRPEQSHQIAKFEENQKTYKALQQYAKDRNAVIKNCSSRSVIDEFEKCSFKEAING